ncbi:MAG: hypothetical protein QXG55_06245 [Thermoplasmata archaeon]
MNYGDLIGLLNGKVYVLKMSGKKEWIPGLGVIDTEKFRDYNYGDKINILGLNFLIVKPTLEDILSNMERITQTIILKDMIYMIGKSGISSSSKVAEIGVGSGFLTVGILYYIRPSTLLGYDISEKNLMHVKNVLDWLGWIDYFKPYKIDNELNTNYNEFDAIFVDIPDPKIYLKDYYNSLKFNGRLIVFLPNITQVIDFVRELKNFEFRKNSIYEIMEREWIYGQREMRPLNTGILHTAFIIIVIK